MASPKRGEEAALKKALVQVGLCYQKLFGLKNYGGTIDTEALRGADLNDYEATTASIEEMFQDYGQIRRTKVLPEAKGLMHLNA